MMGGMGGKAVLHYGKLVPAPCQNITTGRGETLTSFVPITARALYSYSAAIPEELSFSKGDVLAVLRLQDDGWWEAQIEKGRQGVGMVGLVPSNYLQRL
jgi:SH3 domain